MARLSCSGIALSSSSGTSNSRPAGRRERQSDAPLQKPGLVRASGVTARYDNAIATWRKADAADGREYFYHAETRETSWEDPRETYLPTQLLMECFRILLEHDDEQKEATGLALGLPD